MKHRFGSSNTWEGTKKISSKSFTCWNCDENIASEIGYFSGYPGHKIYICHNCYAPSIFASDSNTMGIMPGKRITKLPEQINKIYNEARACISVKAYTAAVMLFRKILMNLAVEEGAKAGGSFVSYVDFLCKNGSVHKKQTKQADEVRKMGNDANHQIECRTEEEAMELLKFIEFLLLNNYEFADEINEEKTVLLNQ